MTTETQTSTNLLLACLEPTWRDNSLYVCWIHAPQQKRTKKACAKQFARTKIEAYRSHMVDQDMMDITDGVRYGE